MAEVIQRKCRTSFLPFHTRRLFLTTLIMTALRYCQTMGVDIPLDQGVNCQMVTFVQRPACTFSC